MNLVPAMETSTQSRPRDAAMPDNSRTHGEERSVRGRDDRGMTTSDRRPLSPPPAAAAPSGHKDPRHIDGDNRHGRPRARSFERPGPGPRHRRRSRDRSRDRPSRSFNHSPLRSKREDRREDLHDHEAGLTAKPAPGPPRQAGRGSHPGPERLRGRSRSPSSHKRLRSPSPSSAGLHPRKSRRDRSPPRQDKRAKPSAKPQDTRRVSISPRRSRSPGRREKRPKPKNKPGKAKQSGPRRGRSRSPGRGGNFELDRKPAPYPSQRRESPRRDPSRSSFSSRRRESPSRAWSPPPRGGRPRTSSDTGSRGRRTPDPDSYRHDYPPPHPHSPKDSRPPGLDTKRRRSSRDNSRLSGRPKPTSGANSIEVNMGARGDFRGGYNGPVQTGYPMKGQYNHGHHPNDPRNYSQSSGHGTPNSSFHGSPPPQSPYGGSRGSWAGQQYSPQSQYQSQYGQGGYPPSGPQGHYQGSQANSPPYGTPTGPSNQQYSQGSYRGGYRGSSGGFRGGHFGSGNGGGHRANFKREQWGADSQSGNGRNQRSQGGEGDEDYNSPHSNPANTELAPAGEDVVMDDAENPFRPSKDLQVEDSSSKEEPEEEQMPPPSRPPPSGPQGSKFSFAFKAASKPAVTAPKPEISQKFNAAPPRRDTYQADDRGRDPRDNREARGRQDTRDRRDSFPRNAPTEPASSRAAKAEQRQRQEQAPRVRKVKKIMKRLKPRPELPEDLASSDSVFFRKPGNESVIGSGTYGKVFKAVNVYTKRLVALKRIRMEGERDGFPVTAVREIKLLQSLRHINIVMLQEVMVEKNDCFMVFEYMSHDLTGILNHPSFKLDAAQRKHLAKQLFEGLDYLHKRGVLHRDIKAANILVSSDGILKLADFGLARFYAKRHQLDYTNRVITIWYRSPELLLGETQYGPGVDIWSAACVMVEIFTRHAIFPGDGGEINQLDKIYAILGTPNRSEWPGLVDMPWFELLRTGYKKPNVFADKYRDRLPAAAFDLLADMFRYDPAKRPSAAEVLEHPYFTTESPPPRQAIELQNIEGDWHEFESKALRRENEKKEREARRAASKDTNVREKDKKRANDAGDSHRDSKRQHVDRVPSEMAAPAAASGVAPSEA